VLSGLPAEPAAVAETEGGVELNEEAVRHYCVVVRAVRPWPCTGLWWEIGLAHALPEAAKALEPRPFVFEAAGRRDHGASLVTPFVFVIYMFCRLIGH
jgi:hypothetical protein